MHKETKYRFNEQADAELERVYLKCDSTALKIKALNTLLGGPSNFYSFGEGEIDEEMKLGCLEYEYLGNRGLIKPVLA